MEVLTCYKVELAKRRRKVRQLADELKMEYARVSRILNAYDHVPEGFDAAVQKIFTEWDKADGKPAGEMQ
jgi:hypothetical protein